MKKLIVTVGILLLTLGVANSSPWWPWYPWWPGYPPEPPVGPGKATVVKEGYFTYWCNGYEPIKIPIEVRQRIRQWLYIYWQPTLIKWDIYKPGWYATNCLYSWIESNGDVALILTNESPTDIAARDEFFISGPHHEPYHVPDVIEGAEIEKVMADLQMQQLLLVPSVAPGQSSSEITLVGCKPHILKLWVIKRVPFHTKPGEYIGRGVITIIKRGE